MISFGFELLVMEMMGVMWSNWRMSDVAETPSSFGITISCNRDASGVSKDDDDQSAPRNAKHESRE